MSAQAARARPREAPRPDTGGSGGGTAAGAPPPNPAHQSGCGTAPHILLGTNARRGGPSRKSQDRKKSTSPSTELPASFRKKTANTGLPETWLTAGSEENRTGNRESWQGERGPERAGRWLSPAMAGSLHWGVPSPHNHPPASHRDRERRRARGARGNSLPATRGLREAWPAAPEPPALAGRRPARFLCALGRLG